jgi:hypothetical protein
MGATLAATQVVPEAQAMDSSRFPRSCNRDCRTATNPKQPNTRSVGRRGPVAVDVESAHERQPGFFGDVFDAELDLLDAAKRCPRALSGSAAVLSM